MGLFTQATAALLRLPRISAIAFGPAAARLCVCASQQLLSLRSFAGNAGWDASAAAAAAAAPAATASARQSSPRLLVLHPASQSEYSLQEAIRLGESYAGSAPDYVAVGSARRMRPSPATFFGRGQVQALAAQVQATQAERIFVNHALSGVQQRNLERALGRPVLDRVALIIQIFSQRARTHEARLQVELASLEYASSRLVRTVDPTSGRRTAFGLEGDVEVVSARERGRSGSSTGGLGGAGGQGESELQLQRRRVSDRRKLLLRRLEQVRRTRAVQRAARQRSGKPQVAIVGYTNAGKSSLLSALSGAGGVGVEDRLFATLDPTLRRVMLPGSGRDVILSDTVGFISDLPTQLVEAFQATLEEVTQADLLLHVLDASSPQVLQQREAVLRILSELGLSRQQLEEGVVEVWNKIDALPGSQAGQPVSLEGGDAAEAELSGGSSSSRRSSSSSGSSSEGSAGSLDGGGEQGSGNHLRPTAAAGPLPEAVEALLASDPSAAAYRPAAVATSVLRGWGLREVLGAVEAKVQALLDRRRQVSRRKRKLVAGNEHHQAELEDAVAVPAG